MALEGIELAGSVLIGTQAPVDVKYGPFDAATYAAAIILTNTEIASTLRYKGLTVGLSENNGEIREYWYKDGIADIDLVVKSSGSGSPLTIQDEGVDVDTATTLINFTGSGQVTTQTSAGEVEVNIPDASLGLTHDKMWSGDASDEPYESDILEASNMADSNLFKIEGDNNTQLLLGSTTNLLNLALGSSIYTEEPASLVLGANNYTIGTTTPSSLGTIAIGNKAMEGFGPGITDGGKSVYIGNSAQEYSVAIPRENVIIGAEAGHQSGGGMTAAMMYSVAIGYNAGTRAAWRDVMIGHSAGENMLQDSSAFSNLVIGSFSYTDQHSCVIGTYSSASTRGTTIGNSASPRVFAADSQQVIIGMYAKAGDRSTTIGYEANTNLYGVSIGNYAGKYWDETGAGSSQQNIFVGNSAGKGDVLGLNDGNYNVGVGNAAMGLAGYDGNTAGGLSAHEASYNVCVGRYAGYVLRSNCNVAIGHEALYSYNDLHWSSNGNVAIGYGAAADLVGDGTDSGTAGDNVFIGSMVALGLTAAAGNGVANNVVIGSHAGTGAIQNRNVIIGHEAQSTTHSATNEVGNLVAIGYESCSDWGVDEEVDSVVIGDSSIGSKENVVVGASAEGFEGGIALGFEASQRNKSSTNTASYRNLISISPWTALGFIDHTKGDANDGGAAGNYCFNNNAEALAAGLKHGDIYVESDGLGSNTPLDPYKLCIVLVAGS